MINFLELNFLQKQINGFVRAKKLSGVMWSNQLKSSGIQKSTKNVWCRNDWLGKEHTSDNLFFRLKGETVYENTNKMCKLSEKIAVIGNILLLILSCFRGKIFCKRVFLKRLIVSNVFSKVFRSRKDLIAKALVSPFTMFRMFLIFRNTVLRNVSLLFWQICRNLMK